MPEWDKRTPEQPNLYPGLLGIWKNPHLTLAEQRLEERFAQQLQHDFAAAFREYRFRHGRILDTDLARGMSPDWDRTNASRVRYTSAVHNPASALIQALFTQMFSEPKEQGRDIVLLTAGGGGSGKTTAVSNVAASLLDRAHLVYDTTLSQYAPAFDKIQYALSAGWEIVIVYVHRPFGAAVRGVIHRAIDTGRTIPLNVLAADHASAPQTVYQLAQTYAENEHLQIYVIDNSAAETAKTQIYAGKEALDFLEKIRHNVPERLLQQAEEVLDNEIQIRRGTVRAIPRSIVAALRRQYRRRTRARTR